MPKLTYIENDPTWQRDTTQLSDEKFKAVRYAIEEFDADWQQVQTQNWLTLLGFPRFRQSLGVTIVSVIYPDPPSWTPDDQLILPITAFTYAMNWGEEGQGRTTFAYEMQVDQHGYPNVRLFRAGTPGVLTAART